MKPPLLNHFLKELMLGARELILERQGLRPIEGGWFRCDLAPCRLNCLYCVTGQRKRDSAALRRPERREWRRKILRGERWKRRHAQSGFWRLPRLFFREDPVLRDAKAILDRTPPNQPVHLTGDDLMEYPRFMDILRLFKAHGRKMELVTPGLKLADPRFVDRLKGYDVFLTITYLSHTPSIYEELTGDPEAIYLLRRAMANMKRAGMPFGVNCVVTRLNCPDLARVGRYLLGDIQLDGFNVPYFYLEQYLLRRNPRAFELFAPFPDLDLQLALLVRLCSRMNKKIYLVDIPPCQVRPSVSGSPHVAFSFAHPPDLQPDSPTPVHRSPACARCPIDGRCSYVSLYYFQQHPATLFDPSRIPPGIEVR